MQKYFSFSKLKSLATTININSSIIKVLSPIIAVGLITSCVPRPKSSPDFNETATFYIKDDSSRLQVTLTNKINGLGLNTSRFLGFTVCVLDKVHSRPVIDKTFDIIREYDNKTFEAKTNESGCMSWTEELELFNPLAIEGYIHITRQITARTPHRGTIAFERAYNPSSKLGEGQTAVINPNIVRVGNLIEEKDLNKLFAIKRHLNVPDGRIKTSFSKNLPNGRRTVSIEANLNVVALVETESHIVQPIKLNQGKFLVDFYWYAKKPNGKKVDRYLLHRQDGISAEILKGSLPLSVDIDLNATPDKDAQLMMGIRLTPVDNQESLLSFEGVFVVAKGDRAYESNIYIDLKPEVVIAQDFKLDKYHTIDARENTPGGKNLSDQSGFLSMRYVPRELEFHVNHFIEHPTKDNVGLVTFETKICINDTVDTSRARNRNVNVTSWAPRGKKGKVSIIQTDSIDGCLKVNSQIEFKIYECHRYLEGQIVLNSDELGMKDLAIPVLINPWAHNEDRIFGRDGRPNFTNSVWATEDYCFKNGYSNNGTLLILQQFRTETNGNGHRYSVDGSLNLTVTKQQVAVIQVREANYSDMKLTYYNNRGQIRDVPYVMRVALVRSPVVTNNGKPETVFFKDLLIVGEGADIRGMIDVEFDDLVSISERYMLLSEVYPAKKSKLRFSQESKLELKPGLSASDAIDWNSGAKPMTFVTSMLANRDDVSPRYINLTANQLQQLFPPETGASNVAFVNLPGFDPDNKVLVANNTQSIIERIVRTYPSQLPARRAELAKRFQGVHEYARLNGLKFLYSNSAESQRLRKIMSLPEGTHAFDVDYGRKLHKLMNLSPMSPNSPLGDTFFRSSPFGLGCFRDPTHPECNFAKLPEVTPADLIKRFENLNIDPRIGTKICQYWYQDLLFNYFNSQTLQKFPNRETMLGQCMEHVQKYGIGAYFKIDRVIKTYQATAANIQVHPWSSNEANISVGTNYSLQENFSDGYGSSFGLSVSRKMFEVFGAGFSGSFGVSWSRNEQVGGGNNASISTGTQVKVQQVILPVKIEKYQRCVSVRLNPKLFFKDNFSPKFNGRSGILSDESYYNQQVLDSNRRYENTKDSSYANTRNLQIQDDLRKFRRMGFLACSEQVETAGSTPFIVNELYSRIWQDLNNDGILDKGYRNNLKYNFSLRGRNDFRNFIVFAKASVGGTGLTIAGYQNAFPSAFFPGEDTSIAESERLLDFSQSTVPGFFVTPLTK